MTSTKAPTRLVAEEKSVSIRSVEFSPDDVAYSARSTRVDYDRVKRVFIAMLQKAYKETDSRKVNGLAAAWGISLNNESLRNIDGRFVQYAENKMTYLELLSLLGTQDSLALKGSDRIAVGKEFISVARIARAFAPENINFLKRVPKRGNFTNLGDGSLPDEYKFPFAPYGLSDSELAKNKNAFESFFKSLDDRVSIAYSQGWVKDLQKNQKRSWVQDFASYCEFRKVG